MVHFGMHGTVEWLPGSPLGSTAESWPDILLGNVPNVYLYACNNPSESLLAKRRGYGRTNYYSMSDYHSTLFLRSYPYFIWSYVYINLLATIVSHNVPPYSRAGLYKELQALREALNEYRTTSDTDSSTAMPSISSLRESAPLIVDLVNKMGLLEDLPFETTLSSEFTFTSEAIMPLLDDVGDKDSTLATQQFAQDFVKYTSRLWTYLSELESRLFSEGLHVIGEQYSAENIKSYLDAVLQGASEVYFI